MRQNKYIIVNICMWRLLLFNIKKTDSNLKNNELDYN